MYLSYLISLLAWPHSISTPLPFSLSIHPQTNTINQPLHSLSLSLLQWLPLFSSTLHHWSLFLLQQVQESLEFTPVAPGRVLMPPSTVAVMPLEQWVKPHSSSHSSITFHYISLPPSPVFLCFPCFLLPKSSPPSPLSPLTMLHFSIFALKFYSPKTSFLHSRSSKHSFRHQNLLFCVQSPKPISTSPYSFLNVHTQTVPFLSYP